MKAVTYHVYGAPEVLGLEGVPNPEPKENEILIRIHLAEVTKADSELRSFQFPVKWFWLPLCIATGLRRPREPILGSYFAGEVVYLGYSTQSFKVGDRGFGSSQLRAGVYSEYLSLPENYTIALLPKNLSYNEAAAVPLGGLNAWHFLRRARMEALFSPLIANRAYKTFS